MHHVDAAHEESRGAALDNSPRREPWARGFVHVSVHNAVCLAFLRLWTTARAVCGVEEMQSTTTTRTTTRTIASRQAILSHVVKNLTRQEALELWQLLLQDNLDAIRSRNWLEGYWAA